MAKNPMFITRQCVVALRHHERYRAYGRRGEPYHFLLSPEKPVGFAPTTEIKLQYGSAFRIDVGYSVSRLK
ncbi:hypothetical protein OUZ56_023142 [Daphnia magna]|uniref:Uncharacterized protein n=1 Tax=Daphnia magna TaxID=35525 RepID=A0ABR0AYL0_9CRUS|nr:hypothetical protein OUZ56_023142 [Daphnia magna]